MISNDEESPVVWNEKTPDLNLKFPPLPRTITEVAIMLAEQSEIPDSPRLVALISTDPVSAAAVLRRANSAYYGLSRQIMEVRHAVMLLGYLNVTNLVLAAGIMELGEILHSQRQRKIFDRLMRCSLGVAFYSQNLAQHFNVPKHSMAFTAGLLHTVGCLIMLYNLPDSYQALWDSAEDGFVPDVAEEKSIFGIDHALLTEYACEEWKLPEALSDVLGAYNEPHRLIDPELRAIGLILNASVAATKTLLNPHESAEAEPAPELIDLASHLEVETEVLAALIDEMGQRALMFIDAMHI